MAVTFRAASGATDSGSDITVDRPTGTADDDYELMVIGFPAVQATIGAVTDPAGWTRLDWVDSASHSAMLLERVASSEPADYTPTWTGTRKTSAVVLSLDGADTTTPKDAWTSSSGAASTAHVAPAVSPSETDSLLVCVFVGDNPGAAITSSYTPPAGMTERRDQPAADGGFGDAPYISVCTQQLSASGSTGTRTAVSTETQEFVSFSIAVASDTPSTDATVMPSSIEVASSIVDFGAEVTVASSPTAIALSSTIPAVSVATVASGGEDVPILFLQVAFEDDQQADPADWTDITTDGRNILIQRGRQTELDRTEPGSLVVTLSNAERQYDPFFATSPHYPYVEPMKQVRVRAVWDGTTYNLFRGFVDSWSQEWPGITDSTVTLTVTDAFKIFANIDLPENAWNATMAGFLPSTWYRFVESLEADVALDSSGNGNDGAYQNGPTLEVDGIIEEPGSDTAVSFDGTTARMRPDHALIAGYPFTVSAVAKIGASPTVATLVRGNAFVGTVTGAFVDVGITFGKVYLTVYNGNVSGAEVRSTVDVNDNERHHLLFVAPDADPANWRLYVDGVDDTDHYFNDEFPFPTLDGGWSIGNSPKDFFGVANWSGVIDDIAVFDRALSASDAAELTHAMRGWTGDLPGDRVARILDHCGWSATLRDIDVGSTELQNASLSGSALDYLLKLAETENGNIYMRGDGYVRFVGRHALITDTEMNTSQFTFGDAGVELRYADLDFSPSDQHIRNNVTVQRAGGQPIIAIDAASTTRYSKRSYSRTGVLSASDNDARATAEWLLAHYKDPVQRVETMTFFPRRDEAMWPAALGLDLSNRITIRRRPGGSTIEQEAHVERVRHSFEARTNNWATTFALSPAETLSFLILDDPVFGLLDSNRVGY